MATFLAACHGHARDPPVDGGGADPIAARVVTSSPAHGAVDVYPARLFGGMAPRVRIAIRFDAPMDSERSLVPWSAVGGEVAQVSGTWSVDAREIVIDLVGAPLTGRPPLADMTTYEVDLGLLRDRRGHGVVPDVGLAASKLRFTTGVYDPLLNHACGHVLFGPYAEVIAAAAPPALAARTDAPHTRYTVALPDTAGGRTGYTRIRAPSDAWWHLFVDGAAPIALETEAGDAVPVATAPTPDACDGIHRRVSFSLSALDERLLRLGPQAQPVTRFIVEIAPCGS